MHDTILGKIKKNDDFYLAQITYLSKIIKIIIDPEEEKLLNQSIQITQELISSIDKFDALSKEILVNELLETYNDGWNSYDEVQDDGSTITVTNPNLSKDEFISKLTLTSIMVSGEDCISLSYDDSDMFWGHQPTVTSNDGLDFSNAEVNI
jgi:hypothetical protein